MTLRLRFGALTSLDVSLDLVSKISQTRSVRDRANAERGAPAAIALEAALPEAGAGGGGGGEGDGIGGGGDGGQAAEERRADEVVDRWALFGFVERNPSLR